MVEFCTRLRPTVSLVGYSKVMYNAYNIGMEIQKKNVLTILLIFHNVDI